jgi:hypothetical protein
VGLGFGFGFDFPLNPENPAAKTRRKQRLLPTAVRVIAQVVKTHGLFNAASDLSSETGV